MNFPILHADHDDINTGYSDSIIGCADLVEMNDLSIELKPNNHD